MGRKLRVEYPGAIYHAIDRGDRRELIFEDDQDRGMFVETLGEACGKTGWGGVHAYSLMPNHFQRVAGADAWRVCRVSRRGGTLGVGASTRSEDLANPPSHTLHTMTTENWSSVPSWDPFI
jgi:hypothetical protein